MVVALMLAGLSHFSFAFMQGMGFVCRFNSDHDWIVLTPGQKAEFSIDPGVGCTETPLGLVYDGVYRIQVFNDTETSDERGVDVKREVFSYPPTSSLEDTLGWPLLRNLFARRRTLLALVASSLPLEFAITDGDERIISESEGRLYVFINEPVLGLPGIWDIFYRRSGETWKIILTRLQPVRTFEGGR
jgi:hypothetical protein